MRSHPRCDEPLTPPRPKKSKHCQREILTPPPKLVFPTPTTATSLAKKQDKDTIVPPNFDLAVTNTKKSNFGMFLPTPSTVGSGRKKHHITNYHISPVKRSISDSLKELAGSDSITKTPPPLAPPVSPVGTPKKKIISEDLVKKWFDNNETTINKDKLLYSDVDDEEEINHVLSLKNSKPCIPNPFLESRPQKPNPSLLANPFGITLCDEKIDYSTEAEFVNHKTGQRVVRKLTSREQRIKPKKLNFFSAESSIPSSSSTSSSSSWFSPDAQFSPFSTTNLPGTTPRPKPPATSSPFASPTRPMFSSVPTSIDSTPFKINNNILNKQPEKPFDGDRISNKFMIKNLNEFMVDGKSKNNLGFEIFNDSKKK